MAIRSLGLVKTSFVDYPGTLSSVLFTHGCNLRCPYCHNPECVLGSPPGDFLSHEDILSFIENRKSILGGVCITGGEPFIHTDLKNLVAAVHAFGLKVKIDTNGTFPELLGSVDADFLDMDIKTSPAGYGKLLDEKTASDREALERISAAICSSITWIRNSGIPHRFRITAAPGIVSWDDITRIAERIGSGESILLSGFSPSVTLDPAWQNVVPYPDDVLDSFAEILRSAGIGVDIHYNHTR